MNESEFENKSDFENTVFLKNLTSAMSYAEQGKKYQAEGNYQAAIADYLESIRLFPRDENISTYYNCGVCHAYMKDYRGAIKYLTHALQINPELTPDAYFNRGTSYTKLQDYERAIEDYTEFLRRNPNDANGYHFRGLCYSKIDNLLEATSDLQRAAELYSSNPELYLSNPGHQARYQATLELLAILTPHENTNSSTNSSSNSDSCFIATAAYSTSTHPDLDTFRNFRDERLLTNTIGKNLVSLYYKISPSLAQYVTKQPLIKSFIRRQLEHLARWMRNK